eukprot:Tbor_TRINITY_DN5770_c0_g3::TRINITY_DN5770_c0_g3_i3::g.19716::m.19716
MEGVKQGRKTQKNSRQEDVPAVPTNQIKDAEGTKHFQHLATFLPLRKSIEPMDDELNADPKRVNETLKESFHRKITARSIGGRNSDTPILTVLRHPLFIYLNCRTERVKYPHIYDVIVFLLILSIFYNPSTKSNTKHCNIAPVLGLQ